MEAERLPDTAFSGMAADGTEYDIINQSIPTDPVDLPDLDTRESRFTSC